MFNDDFYPTPATLIDKMLEGVDFNMVQTVLEPSAGKGDLAEGINRVFKEKTNSRWNKRELDMDTIELEPELQMILKGKGFRVVHNDFLEYSTYKYYDLIISNPPFSQGAKHLLKMIEMQERVGGGIICLLNAETIKNPYTAERKVLARKLEDHKATITYEVGAFTQAERVTDVETAIVKIFIPKQEKRSFIFEDTLKKAEDLEYREREESQSTYLAENDFLGAIVKQFNIEIEAGIRLIDEFNAMKPHILSEFSTEENKYTGSILGLTLNTSSDRDKTVTYNGFVQAVRMKYWRALFSNPKFTGKLTSKLLSDYQNKVQDLANYDFSLYNINTIRAEMMQGVVQGVEEAIIALFDELSHKYHWFDETSNNIHYFNGWKTNQSWIINKKVIIPLSGFDYSYYSNSKEYNPTKYDVINKLTDIEKGFNYLDGGLTDSIDLRAVLSKAKEDGDTKKVQLKYFTVTFYKKGTCHIEFTNLELLKKFNIFGAQNKGWLPPHYGKKGYDEMEPEEKEVIDEFEGKESYERVIQNSGYYLASTDSMLMLESK